MRKRAIWVSFRDERLPDIRFRCRVDLGQHVQADERITDIARGVRGAGRYTEEQEAELLRRSVGKLQRVLGREFRPIGYRSPAWDLSSNSIALLEDQGFLYDSSLMADDFRPYRPRRGDQVDEERLTAGSPSSMLEMPVAWELDDYPYFHWSSKPLNPALRDTEEVYSLWRAEFDYCHRHVADGVFVLTNHPEIIGRGPRILMLERLIDHMLGSEGSAFMTLAQAARLWRGRV
jgi:peptidoglycan/xylan/chitin deacetylase (PgdA/CDA1 family)